MTVKELRKQLEASNRTRGMYSAQLVEDLINFAEELEREGKELKAAVRKACRNTTTKKR